MSKLKIIPHINIGDTVSFGKYKGKTIRYILENQPEYILWASKNVTMFLFSGDIISHARWLHTGSDEEDNYDTLDDDIPF